MALFELTLRGFKGDTDKTDHLILLVETDMTEEQVKDYLSGNRLYRPGGMVSEVITVQDTTTADGADFELPRELLDLKKRAESLVWENENRLEAVLEKLLVAADNHGQDSWDPDYTVGDLQDLLRQAWGIMSVSQRLQLLKTSAVADLTEVGARGEFDADDLVTQFSQNLIDMEAVVISAGYLFLERETGFYWESSSDISEDFFALEDAVASAYSNYIAASAVH